MLKRIIRHLPHLPALLAAFASADASSYFPRGIGGGGALAGFSISPYADLRFVGTDMGTLFRSVDRGKSWTPIGQENVRYNSNLAFAADVGFSADGKTVFFADAGLDPKRSRDGGVTWNSIFVPLNPKERIRYWIGDSKNPKHLLCATTDGLLNSFDLGENWFRVEGVKGIATGTAFVGTGSKRKILHATDSAIYAAEGKSPIFRKWFSPGKRKIRAFAAGSDDRGTTLAFVDDDGKDACAWAKKARSESVERRSATFAECGWVWIHRGDPEEPRFSKTRKEAGRFIRMAENDSQTIYVTGGEWIRQYGSKIWVSRDAGASWSLRLNIFDWDQRPYRPWPKDRLEYSAVGLDVGWNDNAPFSFAVNQRDSSEAGVTGHYFLHTTGDYGEHWKAPFTQFADVGEPAPKKKWKSTGLEVTSVLRLKFHPKNPKLGYAAVADMGGYVSDDGGVTWRISKAKYNTNYDYAFDPAKPDFVWAASGDEHDFPLNRNAATLREGGIFASSDRGITWRRLTPASGPLNRQFLSVAFDPFHRVIYGGTQGGGVARSRDEGATWEFFNSGLPEGDRIIPQLEVDPRDGTVYALLTGDPPKFSNTAGTGIYRIDGRGGKGKWTLLRGTVNRPPGVDSKHRLWIFPSSFAVDFSQPDRNVLWLTDMEKEGAWLASGVWKSTDFGGTWNRMSQFTLPTSVAIDPQDSRKVYVSGLYELTGNWGAGGSLSTNDSGRTWQKNQRLPLSANLFAFTPDPLRNENGFYLFFGGGIFYGPKSP